MDTCGLHEGFSGEVSLRVVYNNGGVRAVTTSIEQRIK
jgi:hypothetical protein